MVTSLGPWLLLAITATRFKRYTYHGIFEATKRHQDWQKSMNLMSLYLCNLSAALLAQLRGHHLHGERLGHPVPPLRLQDPRPQPALRPGAHRRHRRRGRVPKHEPSHLGREGLRGVPGMASTLLVFIYMRTPVKSI